MKKVNTLQILFFLLVPVVIVYYLIIVISKKKNCCAVEVAEPEEEKRSVEISETPVLQNGLNPRQMDLLKYMEENVEGKVSDLVLLFKGTTDRTLRRDFNKLENLGLVKKSGSTKSASYRLVK